ncbi:hypothetical protein JKG47_03565 [Acidithiobacillus sp. MC6.1]|nr:hypothetical protein [Acidithiobacillus sp. MC6.1]
MIRRISSALRVSLIGAGFWMIALLLAALRVHDWPVPSIFLTVLMALGTLFILVGYRLEVVEKRRH